MQGCENPWRDWSCNEKIVLETYERQKEKELRPTAKKEKKMELKFCCSLAKSKIENGMQGLIIKPMAGHVCLNVKSGRLRKIFFLIHFKT